MTNEKQRNPLPVFNASSIAIIGLVSMLFGGIIFEYLNIVDPRPREDISSGPNPFQEKTLGTIILILSIVYFLLCLQATILWVTRTSKPRIFTIVLLVIGMIWVGLAGLIFFVFEIYFLFGIILALLLVGLDTLIKTARVKGKISIEDPSSITNY